MSTTTPPENPRILIIDDNVGIQDDFRKILNSNSVGSEELNMLEAELFGGTEAEPVQQFDLDSALQGRDGYEMVQAAVKAGRPYALAFVDIRMPPGWDGVETAEKIWEVDPALQIVLCTAYSDYSWSDMFAKIGGTDRLLILKKPFDNVEVLQMAHALIAKWRTAQEVAAHIRTLEATIQQLRNELEAAAN